TQSPSSLSEMHYVQFPLGSGSDLRERAPDCWGIGRQRQWLSVVRIPEGALGALAPSAQTSTARHFTLPWRVARVRRLWRTTGGRERQGNRGRQTAQQQAHHHLIRARQGQPAQEDSLRGAR